jgi:transposase-like protein
MATSNILRTYNIAHKSDLYRWINQYKEFGTCVDKRGKATKKEAPNKGRPKKHRMNLEELSKEQLIEKVKMYEDIKKSIAYLTNQQQN